MLKRLKGFRFYRMFGVLFVYLLITMILFAERSGINVNKIENVNYYLEWDQTMPVEEALEGLSPTCLLLTDLGREDCEIAYKNISRMLMDMKVPTLTVDIGWEPIPQSFDAFSTIVVLTPDMEALGDHLLDIMDWVHDGGRVMFGMTMEFSAHMQYLLQKTGVIMVAEYTSPHLIYFDEGFMIGGGQAYRMEDAFDSSLQVQLNDQAKVYAWADEKGGAPLIWTNEFGKGRIVIDNIGVYEKVMRGQHAMAYSLLEDVCAYPVLNGSVFYLDDMPSPVPEGDGTYIQRDYGMNITNFYLHVWFPDVQTLSRKYKFPFTAVLIENYEDDTSGDIEVQTETERFRYFGDLILRDKGEIGYHGYNHQPLMTDATDYRGLYDYNTWSSTDYMQNAMDEVVRFGKSVFPTTVLSVYVPPSNMLSETGRKLLGNMYPDIKTISSTYMETEEEYAYTQEFDVGYDSIVEQPRIISGAEFLDYEMMAALSELNMHLVNTHFMHPDDTLDEDRGAEMGWAKMLENLDLYCDWLFTAAPSLRRLTGSQLSGTIQRWSQLTVDKKWNPDGSMSINLGNFVDYAYLMIRFNDTPPDMVSGAMMTNLTGNLYLLEAESADIKLEWAR